ncbi:MAG: SGNH/GDSL hydrolase family protein [Phycisphaeraceae bacterium]|nr:SGNH/GDSL hydrolase family protein [Phycisphaeraceae bacterium]
MRTQRVRGLSIALIGASLITGRAWAAASLNLAEAFSEIKAKLADGDQGPATIMALGDSLTFQDTSWVPVFRTLVQQEFGNAGLGYQAFSRWTGGGFNPGWVEGRINQDTSPHSSLDGLWMSTSLAGRTAFLDAWSPSIELQFVMRPGGGRFEVVDTSNHVLAMLDSNADGNQIGTWSYTLPEGQKRLWIRTLDDKPVTLLGEAHKIEGPGVRIDRAANGGWGVQNFLQRDWTFDAQLQHAAPDLVMIWLGQNDQGYSQAGYRDKINALVDRVEADLPDASIVLIGTYQQDSGNLWKMVGGMQDVALARGLGFINLYTTAGDHAFFTSHGYLFDNAHFSQAGGQYIGQLIFDAFMTDGASLSQGVTGDYNEDGQVDVQDVNPFVMALTGGVVPGRYGDMNNDYRINVQDINGFVRLLGAAGGHAGIVPEPAALGMIAPVTAWLIGRRRVRS